METKEYRRLADKSRIDGQNSRDKMLQGSLGILSGAGEIAKIIEAGLLEESNLSIEQRKKSLKKAGKILWYLDELLAGLGYSLEEAMKENIKDLVSKYPGKYIKHEKSEEKVTKREEPMLVSKDSHVETIEEDEFPGFKN